MFKSPYVKGINSFKDLSMWELWVVNMDEESNGLFLHLGSSYGVCSFCDHSSNYVLTIFAFYFVFTATE